MDNRKIEQCKPSKCYIGMTLCSTTSLIIKMCVDVNYHKNGKNVEISNSSNLTLTHDIKLPTAWMTVMLTSINFLMIVWQLYEIVLLFKKAVVLPSMPVQIFPLFAAACFNHISRELLESRIAMWWCSAISFLVVIFLSACFIFVIQHVRAVNQVQQNTQILKIQVCFVTLVIQNGMALYLSFACVMTAFDIGCVVSYLTKNWCHYCGTSLFTLVLLTAIVGASVLVDYLFLCKSNACTISPYVCFIWLTSGMSRNMSEVDINETDFALCLLVTGIIVSVLKTLCIIKYVHNIFVGQVIQKYSLHTYFPHTRKSLE